jgi:hypothetical protein
MREKKNPLSGESALRRGIGKILLWGGVAVAFAVALYAPGVRDAAGKAVLAVAAPPFWLAERLGFESKTGFVALAFLWAALLLAGGVLCLWANRRASRNRS